MAAIRISTETQFAGLPISGGTALARVCLFNEQRHRNLPIYKVTGDGAARERTRLGQAIEVATSRLDALIENVAARIGRTESEIFKVHRMILNDPKVVEQIHRHIETGQVSAEAAVMRTLDHYESRLLEVDDEYIKERATDIGEVRRRLLDVLRNINPSLQCEDEAHCQRGRDRVVVAKELTPSLTTELDTEQTRGFVTEHGGQTSHAAILARALGIPAVSGIKGIHGKLSCGTELLINGNTGEVVVWPSEETIAQFQSEKDDVAAWSEAVEPIEPLTVMANINRATDVHDAVRMKAEGIGLYRTEFEFLAAGRLLNEEEQIERYVSVLRAMDGRPVHFRLLDIGGDKTAPFFELPPEDNPYLGFRGSRLLLARADLFRPQARALGRASLYQPVHVLYPMVVDIEQFHKLKAAFHEAIKDIPGTQIRHGLMFEVPSACLQARELVAAADFASIGTNDLTQYLFAVDRNNEFVAHDYTPDRPVFWSLLGQIVDAAAAADRPLSVCGEAASNPQFLAKLMGLGIRTISVSPRLVPETRLVASSPLEIHSPAGRDSSSEGTGVM
jgi:phosphotransferase system enzyme I (PtsI)